MIKQYLLPLKDWKKSLIKLLSNYSVYAPFEFEENLDYELLTADAIDEIVYNKAKPITPLKTFFFPVRENVVKEKELEKRIIIGPPACDLKALNLLDKIFLDKDFLDTFYKEKRDNAIIIGTDCFETAENCHCCAYGILPYPESNCDLSLSILNDTVLITSFTDKGESLIKELGISSENTDHRKVQSEIDKIREKVAAEIKEKNSSLPNLAESGKIIEQSLDDIWREYAKKCVSCGACAVICPTCHCFLLIDKKDFEKIKNWDSCQYPSFERVAAGEDPLSAISARLKNRYLCKYIYKRDMFEEIACTGCGRCIDACIAKIDKNEILIKLNK